MLREIDSFVHYLLLIGKHAFMPLVSAVSRISTHALKKKFMVTSSLLINKILMEIL